MSRSKIHENDFELTNPKDECEKLEQQNQKMRKALEEIAGSNHYHLKFCSRCNGPSIAKQVLKEVADIEKRNQE